MLFSFTHRNYRNLSVLQTADEILKRSEKRERYFRLAVMMMAVAHDRGIRLIMENPWSEQTFLKANFVAAPSMVDTNRMLRGDYFCKPTAYWFVNCAPTNGMTYEKKKEEKTVEESKKSPMAGVCSEDRSMISPDYARNFICDFILGRDQVGTQLNLFSE